MRTGLQTRVDRLTRHIMPNKDAQAPILLALYDTDESDVIAVSVGSHRVARREGEQLSELLARACAETGRRVLCAHYGGLDGGYDDEAEPPRPNIASNDGRL